MFPRNSTRSRNKFSILEFSRVPDAFAKPRFRKVNENEIVSEARLTVRLSNEVVSRSISIEKKVRNCRVPFSVSHFSRKNHGALPQDVPSRASDRQAFTSVCVCVSRTHTHTHTHKAGTFCGAALYVVQRHWNALTSTCVLIVSAAQCVGPACPWFPFRHWGRYYRKSKSKRPQGIHHRNKVS